MLTNKDSEAIEALDLSPIKMKLMHVESGEGWTGAKAEAVEVEYRRFLYLTKKYPNEQISPSVDVDVFWHYHILDTMKYARDCEQIFGYFLHHYPYVGLGEDSTPDDRLETGERTSELYAAEFGQADNAAVSAMAPAAPSQAWCAAPGKRAGAWCAAPAKPGDRAWFAAPAKGATAAWCAAPAKPVDTAWCAAPAKQMGTSWCAAPAADTSSAWCAAPAKQTSAAWCAAPAKPRGNAWCAAPAKQTSTAWCAAPAKPKENAWCAAPAKELSSAWCAAPAKELSSAWCAAPAKSARAWCAAPAKGDRTAWCAAPARPGVSSRGSSAVDQTTTLWLGFTGKETGYAGVAANDTIFGTEPPVLAA